MSRRRQPKVSQPSRFLSVVSWKLEANFQYFFATIRVVSDWRFLTRHARALLVIAQEPESRLRDIAMELDVTERTAYGIVVDLTHAGYVAKEREGRRNRYHVQDHLPLHDSSRPRVLSEFLDMFLELRSGQD
jgi:hypothetical protein